MSGTATSSNICRMWLNLAQRNLTRLGTLAVRVVFPRWQDRALWPHRSVEGSGRQGSWRDPYFLCQEEFWMKNGWIGEVKEGGKRRWLCGKRENANIWMWCSHSGAVQFSFCLIAVQSRAAESHSHPGRCIPQGVLAWKDFRFAVLNL